MSFLVLGGLAARAGDGRGAETIETSFPGFAALMNGLGRRHSTGRGGGVSTPLVVAVDGPAASGKSTLARRLAEHFGLAFLDTGLLYRAVARALLDRRSAFGRSRGVPSAAARALAPEDVEPGRCAARASGRAPRRSRRSRRCARRCCPSSGGSRAGAGCGAGRPRHRHRGLPRRHASRCSSPRRSRSGRGAATRSCGQRGDAPIYAARSGRAAGA